MAGGAERLDSAISVLEKPISTGPLLPAPRPPEIHTNGNGKGDGFVFSVEETLADLRGEWHPFREFSGHESALPQKP